MKKNKTIWILGWMWPWASAEMYMKIIRYCQHEYWAVQDDDYPQIIINSLTLDWFNETWIVDDELVKSQLIEWVKILEKSWSDLIIIACNTVHIFYKDIKESVNVPIFNIVEETKNELIKNSYKKVWILSSQSTRDFWLYRKLLEKNNICVVTTNKEQQNNANKVIENVMGWNQNQNDTIALKRIINNMVKEWADAIVLWCTELPLAINQIHTDHVLFDTMDILVKKSVDFSLDKNMK